MITKYKSPLFLVVWISLIFSAAHAFALNPAAYKDTQKNITADVLDGPVPFYVERVIDGDTYEGRAHIWLGQTNRVRVRLRGIDTPELRGACPHEKQLGKRARDFVAAWFGTHQTTLTNIKKGKYYRIIADVRASDGTLLSEALMQAGLAHAYKGGKRRSWCA